MIDYNIKELHISSKELTELPDNIDKYTNLEILYCGNNQITNLDNLPNSQQAGYEDKPLGLPPTLEILDCSNNEITSLDNLPPTLVILSCTYNKITSLDNLPQTLEILRCNGITSLDYLPLKLEVLYCDDNPLKYDLKSTLENIRNYNASRILSS